MAIALTTNNLITILIAIVKNLLKVAEPKEIRVYKIDKLQESVVNKQTIFGEKQERMQISFVKLYQVP